MAGPNRHARRAAPERLRAPATVALASLAGLAVANGIGRFAFTPILPMMQEDTGLTIAQGGWLASSNYVGYLLGALSAVVIRVRPAAAIRGGLTVIGLATLAMAVEHRFAGWVALRVLAGVASAWVLVSVSAWGLGRLAPLGRPVLDGTVFAGVGAGIVVAGGACLLLMSIHAPSAHAWLALGLLALAATAVTWPVFGADDLAASRDGHRPSRPARRWDSDALRLVLAYGAFGFGYIIPATFLPVMARQAIRDPAIFGWVWPVFGVAAALSTYSGSVAGRLGGPRRLWAVSQLVMALGVVLPAFQAGLPGLVVAAVCVGGTFMVITMAAMQEAREVAGADARRLMAAMTAAFALGQIAGPVVMSHGDAAGRGSAWPLLVAGSLLLVGAGALARHPTSARRAEPG